MKFFHLSDLHIGKHLHRYNLREDQEAVLSQVVDYAQKLHPDAIVIAGDIYDKTVPSGEAVTVFDEFLTALSRIRPAIPVLIISGNHDSAERLQYASSLLRGQQIYLAGMPPRTPRDRIDKVTFTDEYGKVDFYLLPFVKPSHVRGVFLEEEIRTYTEMVEKLLDREKIDYKNKRNVLVSHQFYAGDGEPQTCDSETPSVGGLDRVDAGVTEGFDYVALGHLHGAQRAGKGQAWYCGTLLKYSVSEARQTKALQVVTLEEKGSVPVIQRLELHPLRDVKAKEGTLAELLEAGLSGVDPDYVSITLKDETELYKPKEQLEQIFSHILEIRIDNSRTRRQMEDWDEQPSARNPVEAFAAFYEEMQGREMEEEEIRLIQQIFDSVKGE